MTITEERLDQLETEVSQLKFQMRLLKFQMHLLYDNTEVDRFLFECDVSEEQCRQLMDLMDEYRQKIKAGNQVNHCSFEEAVYKIVPQIDYDYHFCELFTKSLQEANRWPEVFDALYGHQDKYKTSKA